MLKQLEQKAQSLGKAIWNKVDEKTPELMLLTGLVVAGAAAYQFAKSYKKQDEVLHEVQEQVNDARDLMMDANADIENPSIPKGGLGKTQAAKILVAAYAHYGVKAAVHYAPAILLGGTSLALILGSHSVVQGRNKSLVAALQLIDRSFKLYRSRIVEVHGEEVDQDAMYPTKKKSFTQEVMGEDGKVKKKKSKINALGDDVELMQFDRMFDAANPEYTNNKPVNLLTLEASESHMNEMLRWKGVILLNDVYDSIGLSRTVAGCVMGWRYDKDGGDYQITYHLHTLNERINQDPNDARLVVHLEPTGPVYGDYNEV